MREKGPKGRNDYSGKLYEKTRWLRPNFSIAFAPYFMPKHNDARLQPWLSFAQPKPFIFRPSIMFAARTMRLRGVL